ncbi:MAG: hypothetical protein WCP39_06595 [Chlamydiota bacterium]
MTQETVLILTASGGGGLLQAAAAKKQEILLKNPSARVLTKDLLASDKWNWLGKFGVVAWNQSQRHGTVLGQNLLAYFQAIAEYLFWPQFYFETLHLLQKENIDRVIDTQPLASGATLQAIQTYNKISGKKLILEKFIVDLPTKKATHFFRSIRRLSPSLKEMIKVITVEPLLEPNQTAEEFWQKHCNLSEKSICYEKYPIRQGFKNYMGKEKPKVPFPIFIQTNRDEKKTIQKTTQKGFISSQDNENGLVFTIDPNDFVAVILLGSQPSENSTYRYVENFILEGQKRIGKKTALFVYCAEHLPKKNCLFSRVHHLVANHPSYPKDLSVIPFSSQEDDVIASLYHRSDLTITRSGGQTGMELMALAKGKTWIHSESKSDKDIMKGMPCWEAESAIYLVEKCKGKIVTPHSFINHL